jgi:hypothetical protein
LQAISSFQDPFYTSRLNGFQHFGNSFPAMLLPFLSFVVCHPTWHYIPEHRSLSAPAIPGHEEMLDLLSNFTGMKQASMALFSCHSPVKKRAAAVLSSPSIFRVALGEVLPKLCWCVTAQVSLAKSRTDQIQHNSGAIHRYQSCKIT